jgi:predicted MFS family arabinose efflux permease
MPMLFSVLLLLGVVFAGVEVTVIAIARESGETGTAGAVLALWAFSSMIAGLVVGAQARAPALPVQMQVATLGLALTLVPLLLTTDLVVVGVVLFVAGFGVSPSLIAGFSLVEQLVPAARLTEGLTWVTAGISVGFATGSPLTGIVIDRVDPAAGFWVGLSAAVAAASLVRLAAPTWRPRAAAS